VAPPLTTLVARAKGSAARATAGARWEWKKFTNKARQDGLALGHWERTRGEGGRPGTMGEDGEYVFARYNQLCGVVRYDDEEWHRLLAGDPGWGREETDYFFELCDRFDLRFLVIQDRYDFAGAPERTVEDLKHRYFSVARRLLVSRVGGEAAVAHEPVMQHRYNVNAEKDRKHALSILMRRSRKQEQEDAATLKEAAEIEARRRKLSGGGALPLTLGGAELGDLEEPAGVHENAGVPWISSLKHQGKLPQKNVFARGHYVREVASPSFPGGAKTQKLVEAALAELGVGPLGTATAAAATSWLNLKASVLSLVELKKTVVAKQQAAGGGGGAGALSAGDVVFGFDGGAGAKGGDGGKAAPAAGGGGGGGGGATGADSTKDGQGAAGMRKRDSKRKLREDSPPPAKADGRASAQRQSKRQR
jgi:DNA methyltransferase 1-associated protein 1